MKKFVCTICGYGHEGDIYDKDVYYQFDWPNIGEFEYLKEVPEDYKPRKNEIVYELYNKHYIIITKKQEMKEAV